MAKALDTTEHATAAPANAGRIEVAVDGVTKIGESTLLSVRGVHCEQQRCSWQEAATQG